MIDSTPIDTSWILLSAFLVMTMQIGFCMLETGLVRQKNSINVAYKNLMDFVVAGLVFWLVGFGIMYGTGHSSGLFGTDLFLKSHADGATAFFLFQLVFCSAAATIVGGAMAERTRLSSYLLISALVAAVFYPVMGHWAWGGALDNGTPGWLAELGFIDFAGSTVVHGTGGWLALAAVIIVGPRIGRFNTDKPLRGSNYPVATVGVLVLWFGWFGFNGGSALAFDETVPVILVNTSMSAAAGGFALLSWAWIKEKQPNIEASINGTIAGLVGVTAGANIYEATDAILVGVTAAAACGLATKLLDRLKIDDVIGAWPAHAVAGAAGTLMVAVVGDPSAFAEGVGRAEQFTIQATGVATVAAWAFGVGFAVLYVVNKIFPLRVSEAHERIGLNIAEHNASTDLVELVSEMNEHRAGGDFNAAVAVEPHTEVGQIATEYNRVLERVRLEIETREEAYRQLEEASEFRFIFENAHEGIVQFARSGMITKANPAAVALLGFQSEEELIGGAGKWFSKLDGVDREQQLKRMIRLLNEKGVAREVELEFIRNVDGRSGNVQIDLRRILASGDNPTTVLGSIIDISDKMANDRLRIERDSAKAASHAKSEFLANMSHEIRTPLNGVTGMLELLSRTELDTRQSRFLNIAGTSADALLSVINDILDVSKIEAGKLELEKASFSLPELLSDVVDMFAPSAASKSIELASLIPTNTPERVVGDPERLRQVFVNLLGNAIKFTETGSVKLMCRATTRGDGRTDLRFEIEDSGPGISAAERERLFEPFTQADTSTTRKHGGTGLGLTITRQLIELMGGSISVESELGRGTTFTIDIALEVIESAKISSNVDQLVVAASSSEKLRVLAVDDHPINLEIVDGLLESEGFLVTSVDGAEAAMRQLEHAHDSGMPFTLALIDFQMPAVDGRDLAIHIQNDGRYKDMHVIMLTSIDQALSAAERTELNISASITKPLRRTRLFDAINETLGRPQSKPSPAVITAVTDLAAERVAVARGKDADSADTLATYDSLPPLSGQTDNPLNVLIVEDNAVNQLVLDELLRGFGHQTVLAENGEVAIERLARGNIDLVLMDCQMPVMDGFEATRRIREKEERDGTPRLPIVAVTANVVKGDRERCLEAGMDDYVSKPINTEKLNAAIAQHVKKA